MSEAEKPVAEDKKTGSPVEKDDLGKSVWDTLESIKPRLAHSLAHTEYMYNKVKTQAPDLSSHISSATGSVIGPLEGLKLQAEGKIMETSEYLNKDWLY